MKKWILGLVVGASVVSAQAEGLRFTSGLVSNYSTVYLNISGPTNTWGGLHRLSTNDVWQLQSLYFLGTNGTVTVTSSLEADIYGFFRTACTNGGGVSYSTNAFGAVAGYLYSGTSMVGNMFDSTSVTNFISQPVDGLQVFKYTTNFTTATYDAGWDRTFNIDRQEGVIVKHTSTNAVRYLTSGLFDTNAYSRTVPVGLSILTSPLYHLIETNSWKVDKFITNQFGGASLVPVTVSGYNPQSIMYQVTNSAGVYQTNQLSSTNQWYSSGVLVTPTIRISDGFWISRSGTNAATWTVGRPIW